MKLPDAILDHRNAFVGTAGAGKTYAAKSAVEILLARRWRVCIVDPLGVWYGLRSSADGAGPGFDITIFGGAHGDLPLTEAAAPIIAEAVATGHFSCILDLSGLPSQAARRRFMKGFAEAIYARNAEPLHLVLDEADLFCPQRPIEDIAQILGARIDEIVRRGRVKGFIPWLISQRPAVIHKDVLSQVDTLVAFKLTSSQDRDALGAWIEGQADRAEQKRIYAKLPTLRQGDCIVWSPADGILQDYRFPRARTFDSSRTPRRGERVTAPTGWSKPDLEALRAKLASVEQEASESDPKAMRTRIRDLERRVARGVGDPAAIERARQEGDAEGYARGWAAAAAAVKARISGVLDQVSVPVKENAVGSRRFRQAVDPITAAEVVTHSALTAGIGAGVERRRGAPTDRGGAARAILAVLVAHAPAQFSWHQAATLAGLKARGGHFNTGRQLLRERGWIIEADGLIGASEAGLREVGVDVQPAKSPAEVLAMWLSKLPSPAPDMLRTLVDARHPLSRADLARSLGKQPHGGHWNTGLAVLRSNGLVIENSGLLRPAQLFEGAKP